MKAAHASATTTTPATARARHALRSTSQPARISSTRFHADSRAAGLIAKAVGAGTPARLPPPPRVENLPWLIGDTAALATDWEGVLVKRVRELGPVFTTNVFGSDVVLICDGKIGKDFAEKHDVSDAKTIGSTLLQKFFGKLPLDSLSTLADPDLDIKEFMARKRASWLTSYGPRHLPACMPVIRDIFESEFRRFDGCDADVTEILHTCTLQAVWYRFAGYRADGELAERVSTCMADFCAAFRFGILPNWLNPLYPAHKAAKEDLWHICSEALDKIKAEYDSWKRGEFTPDEAKETCMLWQLLKLGDSVGKEVDIQEAVTAAQTALFAGHETTRWSAAGLLLHLQQNPGVWARVREELAQAADTNPSRGAGPLGVYSEAVLTENLRLIMADSKIQKAVLFVPTRKTKRDLECAGYVIPKDTRVMFLYPKMLHAEPAFQRSDGGGFDVGFEPERFIQNGKVVRPEGFAAFGLGPRMCPGMALAQCEMRVLLEMVTIGGMTVRFQNPDTEWAIRSLTSAPVDSQARITYPSHA